jgi:hypothetical protein
MKLDGEKNDIIAADDILIVFKNYREQKFFAC